MRKISLIAAAALAVLVTACGGAGHGSTDAAASASTSVQTAAPFDREAGSNDQVGQLAAYGRELILHTRKHMQAYITSNMDCAACHVNAGTRDRGGTFVGIAAQFPQWNKRAKRVITLHDRIAECFLYSMNGHPPAYYSREMIAMVTYITSLSKGTPIGAKPDASKRIAHFAPPSKPDPKHGAQLYSQKCSMCHGADGQGSAAFPPLWGAKSFNDGAGMHRLWTMAGFVRYNMPQNAPGTLSDQEAYDVSAFVLSHARPKFDKTRVISFPSAHAGFF